MNGNGNRKRQTEKISLQAKESTNCICRTHGRDEGYSLAVVAYRGGQLYCIVPQDGRAEGHPLAVVAYRGGQLYCSRTETEDGWADGRQLAMVATLSCPAL
jgi:hypothetical protein